MTTAIGILEPWQIYWHVTCNSFLCKCYCNKWAKHNIWDREIVGSMPANAPSMLTTFHWNVVKNGTIFYSPSFTSSHVEEFTNIIRQSDFLKHLIIFKHEIKEPTNIWNYHLSGKSSDWTTSWSWRTWQRFDRRARLVLSNRAKPCTSSNNHQKQKTRALHAQG